MSLRHNDSRTPPVFVVFAIAGGVLFLLGGVLTAVTPNDRGVLVVGTVAFLLLGIYTVLVVNRQNRLIVENEDLMDTVAQARDRDRALRARLAVTIREPVATVVTFADRLTDESDLSEPDRRSMLTELRASAQEVDQVLADLADPDHLTPSPRVMGVVRLDEELASVAASTISGVDFESWLEPTRAWADAASVRQVFRAVIAGIRSSDCAAIVLKTDERSDRVTATVSGRCDLLPASGIDELTGGSDGVPADEWHQTLRSAHEAVADMGGTISATHALGVSHIILELPAAPADIRANEPTPRNRQVLPQFLTNPSPGLAMAVDLRPERPTASLRFD